MAIIQFETKEQNIRFKQYLEKTWIGYDELDDESIILDFLSITPCYIDNVKARIYQYKGKVIKTT